MGKWTDYPTKTTPVDTDDIMIYDATGKANKRVLFSGLWNWIVDKMTNAVINNLQTNNKTILGALNELNSNLYVNVTNKKSFSIKLLMPNWTNNCPFSIFCNSLYAQSLDEKFICVFIFTFIFF